MLTLIQRNSAAGPGPVVRPWARGRGGAGGRGGWVRVLLGLLVLWLSASGAAEKAPSVSEYELKAAILPKLSLFITWPANTFPKSESPLRLGVLGRNPFGSLLNEAIKGKRNGVRPISVEVCASAEEAARCHLVFVTAGSEEEMREMLRALAGKAVLTVSDQAGFVQAGGMVGLIKEDRRIGLTVNPAAIQEAGLRTDPQLLRIARVPSPPRADAKP